jgi:hypothetical protein
MYRSHQLIQRFSERDARDGKLHCRSNHNRSVADGKKTRQLISVRLSLFVLVGYGVSLPATANHPYSG